VLTLAAFLVVLIVMGSRFLRFWRVRLGDVLALDISPMSDPQAFTGFVNGMLTDSLVLCAPYFLTFALAGVAAAAMVGGITFSAEPLKPKLSEISPIKGVKQFFSMRSLIRLVLSVAKIVLIAALAWFYFDDRLSTLAALQWVWPEETMRAVCEPVVGLTTQVCIALLAVALADVAFQRYKFNKDMMMTKQEVKEENKQTDGSPEVKNKIRQQQMQMSQKRMLEDVPQADVVIVNPTHVAVALKYDAKSGEAPTVVAKGGDAMCEKIKEIARAYGVPIVRRPKLARVIFSNVEIDQSIPENLFIAVAEVLAMVYRLRQGKM